MPPKRSRKRKITKSTEAEWTSNELVTVPDRTNWPGWVEMESEPALFNAMLRELGVRGVKVEEVFGLDETMLDYLSRPVHALIFLFRYKDADQALQREGTTCPAHVWFARQIPDFACASVALLNIVNNIGGLEMGQELRNFHEFTRKMDPMSRGDAIDSFDFVRNIHNSFARETDLLVADMHVKERAMRVKKMKATAKARETREAKKLASKPLEEQCTNVVMTPSRDVFQRRATIPHQKVHGSKASTPLSGAPDSDSDFSITDRGKARSTNEAPTRRSERKAKPRRNLDTSAAAEEEDSEGFHFVAYMPIQGNVWKLDGLDRFPQDIGKLDSAARVDWMHMVLPTLQGRMKRYAGEGIHFNLMAVVHDPSPAYRANLTQNIKELQTVESALDSVLQDWRALPNVGPSRDAINGLSIELDISQADVDAVNGECNTAAEIDSNQDLGQLLGARTNTIAAQAPLRGLVRDALSRLRRDEEDTRHVRHNYGQFVKTWLGALVENETLAVLLEPGE